MKISFADLPMSIWWMSKFKSFEDIQAWKLARVLALDIATVSIRDPFRRDFSLRDQMRRSIGSVMDNIAEGYERSGNREFIQFLSIAKGSCGEFRSQLYRALDLHYVSIDEMERMSEQAKTISAVLSGLIKYLLASSYKGHKYHSTEE